MATGDRRVTVEHATTVDVEPVTGSTIVVGGRRPTAMTWLVVDVSAAVPRRCKYGRIIGICYQTPLHTLNNLSEPNVSEDSGHV